MLTPFRPFSKSFIYLLHLWTQNHGFSCIFCAILVKCIKGRLKYWIKLFVASKLLDDCEEKPGGGKWNVHLNFVEVSCELIWGQPKLILPNYSPIRHTTLFLLLQPGETTHHSQPAGLCPVMWRGRSSRHQHRILNTELGPTRDYHPEISSEQTEIKSNYWRK